MEINVAFCFQPNLPTIYQSTQNKIVLLSRHCLTLFGKVDIDLQVKLKGYQKSALKREVQCEFG